MADTLDLSDDWAVFDNPIAVTIISPDEQQQATSIAIKEGVEFTTMDSYQVFTARFHVWKAQLNGFIPRIDGTLRDADGVEWSINSVDLETLMTRYQMNCSMQPGIGVK